MPRNSLRNATVVVTGGGGFIGSHLLRRLHDVPGINLVLVSRRPGRLPLAPHVTAVQADCRDLSAQTWESAGVTRVDYVFHLAAEIPKVAGAAAPGGGNVEATEALLASLPSAPRRFVLASSVDVYAPAAGDEPLSESSPLGGSPYGESKVLCERAVLRAAGAGGFSPAILRYGHIYGPGEEAFKKAIPETIRQILRGRAPVVYGDGGAERDFLYVEDVVEATLRAAVAEGLPAEPVNVVRGRSWPIREVVELLVRLTGFPGGIQYLTDRPAGRSLRFCNRRMRALLGDWPLVPLEEGLAREVDYFRGLGAARAA
jgi:nucleoside-diphosphate-sugar epimerase